MYVVASFILEFQRLTRLGSIAIGDVAKERGVVLAQLGDGVGVREPEYRDEPAQLSGETEEHRRHALQTVLAAMMSWNLGSCFPVARRRPSNALPESQVEVFKIERIRLAGAGRDIEHVELGTLKGSV